MRKRGAQAKQRVYATVASGSNGSEKEKGLEELLQSDYSKPAIARIMRVSGL